VDCLFCATSERPYQNGKYARAQLYSTSLYLFPFCRLSDHFDLSDLQLNAVEREAFSRFLFLKLLDFKALSKQSNPLLPSEMKLLLAIFGVVLFLQVISAAEETTLTGQDLYKPGKPSNRIQTSIPAETELSFLEEDQLNELQELVRDYMMSKAAENYPVEADESR